MSYLRHPWESMERQRQASQFGMWVVLGSEVLLFAGLFAAYATYRGIDSTGFIAASRQTSLVYGTLNTAILMTSSLTFALAGRVAAAGSGPLARRLLMATFALGTAFLVVKGFEYADDISRHLLPSSPSAPQATGALQFLSLYWIMTGVHAIHVTGGLVAVAALLLISRREAAWLRGSPAAETVALYWHLVDVIWVVLYPLLYLSGRSHG
jgi:cytochrome c oxidase subunit 3